MGDLGVLSTDAGVQIAVAVVGALFFTSHGWVVVALQPQVVGTSARL